jgi:hypothetical protein
LCDLILTFRSIRLPGGLSGLFGSRIQLFCGALKLAGFGRSSGITSSLGRTFCCGLRCLRNDRVLLQCLSLLAGRLGQLIQLLQHCCSGLLLSTWLIGAFGCQLLQFPVQFLQSLLQLPGLLLRAVG